MKIRLWISVALGISFVALAVVLWWAHIERAHEKTVFEAERLLAEGRYHHALNLAEEALAARPALVNAHRIRVESLSRLGERRELEAAKAYWEKTYGGDALVRLIQAAMRWDVPEAAFKPLSDERSRVAVSDVNRVALLAVTAARWGDYQNAANMFELAKSMGYPENDQSRFTSGILLIESGNEKEGMERLEGIPPESAMFSESLRVRMRQYRQADRIDAAQGIAEPYFNMPNIPLSEKLTTLEFIFDQVSEAWKLAALDWIRRSARSGEAVADLLIWAYKEDRAVEWADEALAALPPVAFTVEALELVAVAREWQLRSLGSPDDVLPQRYLADFEKREVASIESPYAMLLRLGMLADERIAATTIQHRVLARNLHAHLVRNPKNISGLDHFARALSLMPVWETALLDIMRETGASADSAAGMLYRIYSDRGDTRALFRLMEQVVKRKPDNILAQHNYVHLGLLLETDPPKFFQLAESIANFLQLDVRFANTVAFALHLQGRNEEALSILEAHSEEARKTGAVPLYYGMILKELGEEDRARSVISGLDKDALLDRERFLADQLSLSLGQSATQR